MFKPQVNNMNGSPTGQAAQQPPSNHPGNIDLSLMPPNVQAFMELSRQDEAHLDQQERQVRDTVRIIQAQQDAVNYENTGRLPQSLNRPRPGNAIETEPAGSFPLQGGRIATMTALLHRSGALNPNSVPEKSAADGSSIISSEQGHTTSALIQTILANISDNTRDAAQPDGIKLRHAVANLNKVSGTLVSHGNDWSLRGMKTNLKHFQVIGLDFLRRQEHRIEEPKGGILADSMGLGKTVEMIANIVMGRQDYLVEHAEITRYNRQHEEKREQAPRSTLIVLPSSLLAQWSSEIALHADVVTRGARLRDHTPDIQKYGIRGVVKYADLKHITEPANKIAELENHDIVLVTYNAVRASFPLPKGSSTAELEETDEARQQETMSQQHVGILHRIKWRRVVLDEAHFIKNHLSATSVACCALQARHFWAMTGTPVMNSITEFFPYFKLIRQPAVQSFHDFITAVGDTTDDDSRARLMGLLSKTMLRRTMNSTLFGRPILKMTPAAPARTLHIEFNSTERFIYSIMETCFRAEIKSVLQTEGSTSKVYGHLFTKMLRLRQATGHFILLHDILPTMLTRGTLARLCKHIDAQEAHDDAERMRLALTLMCRDEHNGNTSQRHDVEHPIADLDQLRELVPDAEEGVFGTQNVQYADYFASFANGSAFQQVEQQTSCALCHNKPDDAHITDCGHVYCYSCLEDLLRRALRTGRNGAKCYVCGNEFKGAQKCYQPPANHTKLSLDNKSTEDDDEPIGTHESDGVRFITYLKQVNGPLPPSSKTVAMKALVQQWVLEDPNVKILVYSQFLNLLKVLENVCQSEGWKCQSYIGNMDLAARNTVVESFNNGTGDVRILLMSLKCGSLGLNLTAASKVLLMDSWFNDSVEEQAFHRVFRQGQTKVTQLTRLVVNDTIDESLEAMKHRKSTAISGILDNGDANGDKLSLEELIELFGDLDSGDEHLGVFMDGEDAEE